MCIPAESERYKIKEDTIGLCIPSIMNPTSYEALCLNFFAYTVKDMSLFATLTFFPVTKQSHENTFLIRPMHHHLLHFIKFTGKSKPFILYVICGPHIPQYCMLSCILSYIESSEILMARGKICPNVWTSCRRSCMVNRVLSYNSIMSLLVLAIHQHFLGKEAFFLSHVSKSDKVAIKL